VKKRIVLLILLISLVLPLGVGWARSAEGSYQIPWDAYASGGEAMTSENYGLSGMAGQELVGGTAGSNYQIGAGFWGVLDLEKFFEIFLPLILR